MITAATQNAASFAEDHRAYTSETVKKSQSNNKAKSASRHAVSASLFPDRIKRVSRTVGYALVLADADAWHGLTVVLTARLTPKERVSMAWAVLRSMTPEHIIAVAEAVLPQGIGQPIAPLFSHMNEAAFWADMAEPEELEAYCLASFIAMPTARQSAFLGFVQGRQAA